MLIALVTLTTAVVVASPQVRAALLDVLRVGSVEVHPGPAPTATPSPSGRTPASPERPAGQHTTTLAAARPSADFHVFVPAAPLQRPDEVLVEDRPRRRTSPCGTTPAKAGRGRSIGVAVQVDEIAGDSTRFFQKYLTARRRGWSG